MAEVRRIYPESKSALINYIEQNFHDIDQFVITILHKDNSSIMIYDTYTYLEALGMTEIQRDNLHMESHNGTFVCKARE